MQETKWDYLCTHESEKRYCIPKKTLAMIEAPEARYLTEQLSHLVKGNYL
ncbi:hypothetical protein H8744_00435 [Oscillospiraceae bacterium N12]|uniref:Uncharacterized protein n=1 Tax=Jilunia laotingensis TaxID=2763675 RepID=A0A926F1N2_9BACT|nr:hypothetical protein [Jilunia laotingensis]MBC8591726.1 hypothetical protein [Jilunia laotingensis]